ncbi:hypothetical protein TNCV_1336211 [Trichonephila clavipes]|nr:hypothetical protein TNCV_1336211 [Trichonephila clavipes]
MVPAYNKKRGTLLFLSRRESISGEMTDFFPEEDTSKSYSGFEPEPIRLQAEALADGITRCALFNVWKEEQDPELKTNAVLSLVRTITDFNKYGDQQQLKFRKIAKNSCLFVGEKWMRCHRNEKFLSRTNDVWF